MRSADHRHPAENDGAANRLPAADHLVAVEHRPRLAAVADPTGRQKGFQELVRDFVAARQVVAAEMPGAAAAEPGSAPGEGAADPREADARDAQPGPGQEVGHERGVGGDHAHVVAPRVGPVVEALAGR